MDEEMTLDDAARALYHHEHSAPGAPDWFQTPSAVREQWRTKALVVLQAASVHPGLLRWCRWPECWEHFNAAKDHETKRGWLRLRSDLLCPTHSPLGHWPGWQMTEGEGPRGIIAQCRCGAEHPIPSGAFVAAEQWWDNHVRPLVPSPADHPVRVSRSQP